jgi:hypothetical protein
VSVFLRWGILGILSVAALLYAYNASKRMAAAQRESPAVDAGPMADATPDEPVATDEPEHHAEPADETTPVCAQELAIARLAIEMREQGEPLDRVLRTQEIAWQEPAERRARLEVVARTWFERAAPVPDEELRAAVLSECTPGS